MRWLLPLLLIVGLGWLSLCCTLHHAELIEADLRERAAALIGQHPWATVVVDGRDLTVTGTPPTPTAAGIVLDQLNKLHGVYRVRSHWAEPAVHSADPAASSTTMPPGLNLSASLNPASHALQHITLHGTLPSKGDVQSLQTFVARHRRRLAVDSMMTADNSASHLQRARFRQAVASGTRGLLRLKRGELQVDEHQVSLRGVAGSGLARRQIEADVRRNLPAGYVLHSLLSSQFTHPDPLQSAKPLTAEQQAVVAACQAGFDALMQGASIQFAHNSDKLDATSAGLLDRIAVQAKACQNTRMLIGGHSDSSGDPAYNIDLSQRRAEAVRQALITRGIAATRMQARGFGDANPRASNDNASGRAANRRIEFTLSYKATKDTP